MIIVGDIALLHKSREHHRHAWQWVCSK